MRGQRFITQLLLLFALLAGQQFALVHAVSHIPDREAAGSKAPGLPHHGELCAKCLLSSHLAHALPWSAPLPPPIAVVLPEALPVRASYIAAIVLAFHSRAPPAPL